MNLVNDYVTRILNDHSTIHLFTRVIKTKIHGDIKVPVSISQYRMKKYTA